MGRYEDFWGGYTPSKPIQVEGGIKAKSKKGNIGDTWWSKRWVSVLESFGWSNRLERGRRYARKGQVLDFEISTGKVEATVQGSVKKPYSVTIEIKPITEKAWDHITEEMSRKAIFAAKLLAGEMPDDIEEAFEAEDISLFPEKSKEIKTCCSCPDSANPCKHIAAVYYILAEEFDRNPFMIFKLRGRTKDEIISSLRQKRTDESLPEPEGLPCGAELKEVALSMDDFWEGKESESFSVNISPPDVSAAVIKRLGTPQFWDSKDDFVEKMGGYYEEISRRAVETAYCEQTKTKKK
jgi:uncharacterized Zn finger protein